MNHHILLSLLLALLLVESASSQVEINQSAEYKYSGPKSKLITIPHAAFKSAESDLYHFIRDDETASFKHFKGGNGNTGYATAPVTLPHGSKVTQISAWIRNTDILNAAEMSVMLMRVEKDNVSAAGEAMATIVSTSFSPVVFELTDDTITGETIDHTIYDYILICKVNNNNSLALSLYGTQIHYTITHAE